jgi:hypothetical protein
MAMPEGGDNPGRTKLMLEVGRQMDAIENDCDDFEILDAIIIVKMRPAKDQPITYRIRSGEMSALEAVGVTSIAGDLLKMQAMAEGG